MLYTLTVTPYRLAFIDEDTPTWYFIGLVIDSFFMFDVLVNSISGYYDSHDNLIVSRKKIFLNYCTG